MPMDDVSGLNPEFYGLNYLGRPVSVSVLGESPTGGVGTVGATAAGGLGPQGGPAQKSTAAASSSAPAQKSGNAAKDIANAIQGTGLAKDAFNMAGELGKSKLESYTPYQPPPPGQMIGEGSNAIPAWSVNTPGQVYPGSIPEWSINLPGTAGTAPAIEGASGAGAGAAAEGGGAASGAAGGGLAGASVGPISALYGYLVNQAAQALPAATRSKAEIAATMAQPELAAFFPDFWGALFSGNLGSWFSGKPPAMAFPSSSWEDVRSQVGKALPQNLPTPEGLSKEHLASINQVNTLLDDMRTSYTGNIPSYLGGKQSAESWRNTMNTMTNDIQSKFGKIQDLYPKAYQGLIDSYTSALPKNTPQGAPSGLTNELNSSVQAVQAALQAGDYNKAAQLMSDPNVKNVMQRYAPELTAGQTQGGQFLKQGKKPENQ